MCLFGTNRSYPGFKRYGKRDDSTFQFQRVIGKTKELDREVIFTKRSKTANSAEGLNSRDAKIQLSGKHRQTLAILTEFGQLTTLT